MKKISVRKSGVHGCGLFADEAINKDEVIAYIDGKKVVVRSFDSELAKKSQDWIGIGRFSWIDTYNSIFRYINHSCTPNSYIMGTRTLTAMKDIGAGEEISMDYSFTEADPNWSIRCHCNTQTCRKLIGPITSLSPRDFKKNLKFITKKFQKVYNSKARVHN